MIYFYYVYFFFHARDLSRQSHWLTLSFRDSGKETEFTKHLDPYAGIYYGACPCALVAVALAAFSVVSFTFVGLVVLLVGLVFLGLITTFSACETSPMKSRLKVRASFIFACHGYFLYNCYEIRWPKDDMLSVSLSLLSRERTLEI